MSKQEGGISILGSVTESYFLSGHGVWTWFNGQEGAIVSSRKRETPNKMRTIVYGITTRQLHDVWFLTTKAWEPDLLMEPVIRYQNDALKRRNKLFINSLLGKSSSWKRARPWLSLQLWDWLIKSQTSLPLSWHLSGHRVIPIVLLDMVFHWAKLNYQRPRSDLISSQATISWQFIIIITQIYWAYTMCWDKPYFTFLSQFILTTTLRHTSVPILQMNKLRLRERIQIA